MILDRLENAARYASMQPGFAEAFAFLGRSDLGDLPAGRYEIRGGQVYAMVACSPGRTRDAAALEAHRQYIDVQYVLSGVDEMGWKARSQCRTPREPYDAEKDVELFADAPDAWVAVGPGTLAIFFPGDAHAPLVGDGLLHKVVVKVAVA